MLHTNFARLTLCRRFGSVQFGTELRQILDENPFRSL